MWHSPARKAQTTIPCKECGSPLEARRTCHEAYLHCERCRKDFPLGAYIAKMDQALERFLESLHCNRI